MSLFEAQEALDAAGYDTEDSERDLSWKHRDVDPWDDDWTAVRTVPAAGTRTERDADVYVFVLQDTEYDWFSRHRRMPKVRGKEGFSLIRAGGQLSDVYELVEFRYERGVRRNPAGFTETGVLRRSLPEPISYGSDDNPSVEPNASWRRRSRFRPADTYDFFARTLQAPKAKLRFGQILTVLLRPPAPDDLDRDGDVDRDDQELRDIYVYVDGDDDDDFNVPGWMCPTRFC